MGTWLRRLKEYTRGVFTDVCNHKGLAWRCKDYACLKPLSHCYSAVSPHLQAAETRQFMCYCYNTKQDQEIHPAISVMTHNECNLKQIIYMNPRGASPVFIYDHPATQSEVLGAAIQPSSHPSSPIYDGPWKPIVPLLKNNTH